MKRIIYLLFIFITISSVNLFGQRGTTIGIDGSYNSTWIFWPNAYGITQFDNTKMKYYTPSYGYEYSLSIGQNFVDVLGIKAEIGYSTQNQKYDNTSTNSTKDIQLKYLQVPVMIRLCTKGDHFLLHFMFGPQFGFLSSAEQANVKMNDLAYEPGIKTITERYNKMDMQGIVDLGCDVYLTDRLLLDLGIRLHGSLKDINKSDWQFTNNNSFDYHASKNVYGGINIGLTYALHNWYKMK